MSVPGTARYKPLGGRSSSAVLAAAAASTARSRASAAATEAKPEEDGGGRSGGGGAGGGRAAATADGARPRHHGRHHHRHSDEVAPGYTLEKVAALVQRVVTQKVGKDSDMCRHSACARTFACAFGGGVRVARAWRP